MIDGRVGETFSGIRVVRAFGREIRELLALHARAARASCARNCSRIAASWCSGRRGACSCPA